MDGSGAKENSVVAVLAAFFVAEEHFQEWRRRRA
jgi:hypothetical protein